MVTEVEKWRRVYRLLQRCSCVGPGGVGGVHQAWLNIINILLSSIHPSHPLQGPQREPAIRFKFRGKYPKGTKLGKKLKEIKCKSRAKTSLHRPTKKSPEPTGQSCPGIRWPPVSVHSNGRVSKCVLWGGWVMARGKENTCIIHQTVQNHVLRAALTPPNTTSHLCT